jgi:hypothetical protein
MLATPFISQGLHHAKSEGNVVAGADFGEVAGVGASQLCRFLLPFAAKNWQLPGFADQFYTTFKTVDGNISAAVYDAQEFETDPTTGQQVVRLRLDVGALPASVQIFFESHHSAGR